MTESLTIGDCSRLWYFRQGIILDRLPIDLSNKMHEIWVNYAFAGFSGNKPNEYGIRPGKVYMRDQ